MVKVLLGFMGAGKSTIARGLDPDYLDMDALIEEIFSLKKEKRPFVRWSQKF